VNSHPVLVREHTKYNFTNPTANSFDTKNDVTFSPDVFTFPAEVLKNPDEENVTTLQYFF